MSNKDKLDELTTMMEVQWKTAKYFQETLAAWSPSMGHHKAGPELLDRTCHVARGLAAVIDVWKFLRDERDMLEGETPAGTVLPMKE